MFGLCLTNRLGYKALGYVYSIELTSLLVLLEEVQYVSTRPYGG